MLAPGLDVHDLALCNAIVIFLRGAEFFLHNELKVDYCLPTNEPERPDVEFDTGKGLFITYMTHYLWYLLVSLAPQCRLGVGTSVLILDRPDFD